MEVVLEVLRSLKLRARSRQSDGQAPAALQARDQPIHDDPLEGGMLRADRGRQETVLQARDGRVPGPGGADRGRGEGSRRLKTPPGRMGASADALIRDAAHRAGRGAGRSRRRRRAGASRCTLRVALRDDARRHGPGGGSNRPVIGSGAPPSDFESAGAIHLVASDAAGHGPILLILRARPHSWLKGAPHISTARESLRGA